MQLPVPTVARAVRSGAVPIETTTRVPNAAAGAMQQISDLAFAIQDEENAQQRAVMFAEKKGELAASLLRRKQEAELAQDVEGIPEAFSEGTQQDFDAVMSTVEDDAVSSQLESFFAVNQQIGEVEALGVRDTRRRENVLASMPRMILQHRQQIAAAGDPLTREMAVESAREDILLLEPHAGTTETAKALLRLDHDIDEDDATRLLSENPAELLGNTDRYANLDEGERFRFESRAATILNRRDREAEKAITQAEDDLFEQGLIEIRDGTFTNEDLADYRKRLPATKTKMLMDRFDGPEGEDVQDDPFTLGIIEDELDRKDPDVVSTIDRAVGAGWIRPGTAMSMRAKARSRVLDFVPGQPYNTARERLDSKLSLVTFKEPVIEAAQKNLKDQALNEFDDWWGEHQNATTQEIREKEADLTERYSALDVDIALSMPFPYKSLGFISDRKQIDADVFARSKAALDRDLGSGEITEREYKRELDLIRDWDALRKAQAARKSASQ